VTSVLPPVGVSTVNSRIGIRGLSASTKEEMKAYIFVMIHIDDFEAYKPYVANVPQTIADFGGTYLVRNGTKQLLEGELPTERIVILEFPSVAQANEWYQSEEYQAIKPLRTRATHGNIFIVEGASQ